MQVDKNLLKNRQKQMAEKDTVIHCLEQEKEIFAEENKELNLINTKQERKIKNLRHQRSFFLGALLMLSFYIQYK